MSPTRGSLIGLFILLAPLGAGGIALPPCSKSQAAPAAGLVPLFELHKDRNPENVIVVHTYADTSCRLAASIEDKRKLVDMYWRMNAGTPRECWKPVNPEIKSETLKSLEVQSLAPDRRTLRIDIKALDRVHSDLPSRVAEVALTATGSRCAAAVRLPLGPAEHGAVLRIREIRAKGTYRLGVPRKALSELELSGVDAHERPVRAVFRGK